jgi:hypothetical protein
MDASVQGIEENQSVWPDWYATLYAIPGFKVPLPRAKAWLEKKEISEDHAENTALSLKSKWPGPTKLPYRDPWATFQRWAKRPAFSNNGSRPTRATRADIEADPEQWKGPW